MAETQPKRLRDEPLNTKNIENNDLINLNSKRQKPYNNILSLLDIEDDEDEEPNQDYFSSIFTTLQQELTFDDVVPPPCTAEDAAAHHHQTPSGGEDVKSVMRHLLEASDDELGIPNVEDKCSDEIISSEEIISLDFNNDDYNCLWEVEDVDANYYAMVQPELFM